MFYSYKTRFEHLYFNFTPEDSPEGGGCPVHSKPQYPATSWLAIVFQECLHLKTLELESCDITGTLIESFKDPIKYHKFLWRLNLRKNKIGDLGAEVLSDVLRVNSTLSVLDLEDNYINSLGFKHLADALTVNWSLKFLGLKGNFGFCEGAIALGEGLKRNTALKVLNLEDNKISSDGVASLREVLRYNKSLQCLYLGDNFFDLRKDMSFSEGNWGE